MAEVILLTGGARSGKSAHALALTEGYAPRVFIATAEAFDDEMRTRIERHQAERGDGWETLEAPYDLPTAIESVQESSAAIVVDCLTVWLGNLLHRNPEINEDAPVFEQLSNALTRSQAGRIILVTNEVGMSIVPENALARNFRDLAGRINQRFATLAGCVKLVVCGQVITIKHEGCE